MEKKNHVLIVGGGASGIIAGISAARLGAQVTIFERNQRIGKKVLATGNGRCNFTNVNTQIECYYGKNPAFAYGALKGFTVKDTIKFFQKLGIEHKVEDMGKVFPMSDQASSILDVLLYELNDLKINIVTDAFVKSVIPSSNRNRFLIRLEDGKEYWGNRVIIATGGKAMPSSGSDGNGYSLVTSLGHSTTRIFPSLVQIMLEGSFFKRISGVKLTGTAEIVYKDKSIARDRGDILFADYGISGPPILQISREVGRLLIKGKEVYLKINIMDEISKEKLKELIKKRFHLNPNKSAEFSFVGLINKRLIPVILIEAVIKNVKMPVSSLSLEEIDRIANVLTDWRFKIRGTKSWSSAQVTAGGIKTHEINQATMESKLIEGLYFAGEIIDIDGKCGGYNLQWAWSSGFIAGENAALK